MLEGATAVLANVPKPIWLIEIMASAHQPTGVEMNPDFLHTFELFIRNGYRVFTADQEMREEWRPDTSTPFRNISPNQARITLYFTSETSCHPERPIASAIGISAT